MILRYFFFYTIFISFWFVPFFGSNFAFAKVQDYAHAVVKTSTGKEIPVEVADTIEKRRLADCISYVCIFLNVLCTLEALV